jgi:hypothetical protein
MAKTSFINKDGPAEALCEVLTDITRVSKAVSVKWNTEYGLHATNILLRHILHPPVSIKVPYFSNVYCHTT